MKTPRDLLFARHRQAGPKLDALRRAVVESLPEVSNAAKARPLPGRSFFPGRIFRTAWLELIWPSRCAWGGLAALWLALLAANVSMRSALPASPAAQTLPAREVVQSIEEQRRLLAELLQPVNAPPAIPARLGPQPRSERSLPLKAA